MGNNRLLHTILLAFASITLLTACTPTASENKEEIQMTQEEKEKLQRQQEALALFLVNNYEDIHKIEFVDMTKGGFGIDDSVEVVINSEINMRTALQESYGAEKGYGFSYEKDTEVLKKKEKVSHFTTINDIALEIVFLGEGIYE